MKCQAGCRTGTILDRVGLKLSDLFPEKQVKATRSSSYAEKKIIAEYDYLNESGELLYQVCRTEPKGFIQRRRDGDRWVWNLRGIERVIFRLPQVKAAVAEGRTIYIVEGEKDVLALERWGLVGTCNPGGAGKWLKGYNHCLAGADVVVLPYNDEPGRKHAEELAQSLLGIARRIRVVTLPDLPAKGDVSDWIAAGGTLDQLEKLQHQAKEYAPGSVHQSYQTPQGIDRIAVNNAPLRKLGRAAIRTLAQANTPPYFFLKGGSIVRYRETEASIPLIERVTESIVGSRLADVADFVLETQETDKQLYPPKDVIRYVLSSPDLPFPKLVGVTESPLLRSDGTILESPGYDPATGYYYKPTDGFEMPKIPENPTDEQLQQAVDLIQESICDFPFVDQASRANTIALMLTPLLKNLIPKSPIALVDATIWGTGKTLLTEVVGMISCGTYELSTVPDDREEWRKRITALLSMGSPFIVLDNVKTILSSESLAAVLTTLTWSDRKLGVSETVALPNHATWVATGNNLQTDGEMARRGYLIQLDAQCARPYERDYAYKHPELLDWVSVNRGMLVAALLTIIRSWFTSGKPIALTPKMGSFEGWVKVIGSILANAGIPGFLENRDKLLGESDTESTQWEAFLCRWVELYSVEPKTVSDIKDDLISPDGFESVLPGVVSYAIRGSTVNPHKIGNAFRAKEGTRFGRNGLYLQRAGEFRRAILWTVCSAVIPTPCEFDEFCEFPTSARARESVFSTPDTIKKTLP